MSVDFCNQISEPGFGTTLLYVSKIFLEGREGERERQREREID